MRFSLKTILIAGALACAGLGAGVAQAAGPAPMNAGIVAGQGVVAEGLVTQAQYYGRRYYGPPRGYYGRRYYRGPRYYGPRYYGPRGYYRPRVVCSWRWRPTPWGPRRVRVCW